MMLNVDMIKTLSSMALGFCVNPWVECVLVSYINQLLCLHTALHFSRLELPLEPCNGGFRKETMPMGVTYAGPSFRRVTSSSPPDMGTLAAETTTATPCHSHQSPPMFWLHNTIFFYRWWARNAVTINTGKYRANTNWKFQRNFDVDRSIEKK